MAEPISNIKRIEFSDEEILERNLNDVIEAVSVNKDSVMKAIELITTLDDNGMLDFVNSLIKQKEAGLSYIFGELNQEQYANTLENASDLIFLLGDIDFKQISQMTEKINSGLTEALSTDSEESTTYIGMLKALKDPEINRSITMLLMFLRGMGRQQ